MFEQTSAAEGTGRLLMTELIDRAREAGKHVMVAGIEASNEGSIRLHEKLGFRKTGTLRRKSDQVRPLA